MTSADYDDTAYSDVLAGKWDRSPEHHPLHPVSSHPVKSCHQPTNIEFLVAIFGANAGFSHVTGFPDDPSNIANERRSACWGGGHADRANGELTDDSSLNQYFCISLFRQLEQDGKLRAVRRKSHFLATYCIVIDDVKDKIPEYLARLLPEPAWKLETSPGNEQWGYIITLPEQDRARVENLLDGLVAQGLAPDGTDPGMKGVTRYVRLPGGSNSKAKYGLVPYKCRMVEWEPTRRTTLEALAAPFQVDLHAPRGDEGGVVNATGADDHPVLGAVSVLDEKASGEYLIECPWVAEHSDGDTSGTILYVHADGGIGFRCHHGHCQDRTGGDLLKRLELADTLDHWRGFRHIPPPPSGVYPEVVAGWGVGGGPVQAEQGTGAPESAATASREETLNKIQEAIDGAADPWTKGYLCGEAAKKGYTPLLPQPPVSNVEQWQNGYGSGLQYSDPDLGQKLPWLPLLIPEIPRKTLNITTAGELHGMEFAPIQWLVTDLLPPGVCLMIGDPKIGKSWFMLGLGIRVSAGMEIFGKETTRSTVLYMGLEDSDRRLKERIDLMITGASSALVSEDYIRGQVEQRLLTTTACSSMDEGLFDELEEFLERYPDCRLIIIDVLVKVRADKPQNLSLYKHDYQTTAAFQPLCKAHPELSIILVHHTNKSGTGGVHAVSGTHGLAGGCDNVFGLRRGDENPVLEVNGRDIAEDGDLPMIRSEDGTMWTFEDRGTARAKQFEKSRLKVMIALQEGCETPKEISSRMQMPTGSVDQQLKRMRKQEQVTPMGRGKWAVTSTAPKMQELLNAMGRNYPSEMENLELEAVSFI